MCGAESGAGGADRHAGQHWFHTIPVRHGRGYRYLKFFEDLNNEQIAMVLKKNRRQIENMIYQAKQALKSELDKEGVHYEGL